MISQSNNTQTSSPLSSLDSPLLSTSRREIVILNEDNEANHDGTEIIAVEYWEKVYIVSIPIRREMVLMVDGKMSI